jgi:hypothetical protein
MELKKDCAKGSERISVLIRIMRCRELSDKNRFAGLD